MAIRRASTAFFCVLLLLSQNAQNALGQEAPALPAQIAPQAVRQTKQATVYLKVTGGDGKVAEGSGFLAIEPGIVVTNAHVLGMLGATSKPPTKVEVVVNSGEPNELKLTGKVLGVDRAADLGILRVEGKLPAPLQLGLKHELVETQKVYIFGFPFGEQLGKNITVSESSISSLRRDANGVHEKIQVNGGMHPGNSGGPVVNSLGQVVGVSVAGIRATQINFAVPAAMVQSLLDGRIQDVKAGELFQQVEEVRVPLEYGCLDPCRRIREVRVEVWAGNPAVNRSFSPKKAEPLTGDGARKTYPLKYADDAATAEVLLPKLAKGQVAWVQPVLVFAKGEPQWGAPKSFDAALALQRIPADLTFKLADQKERTVHLKTSQSLTLAKGKSKLVMAQTSELDILEAFGPDAKGALVRTNFGRPDLTITEDEKTSKASPQVANLLQRIPPAFVIDETNKLRSRVNINLSPKLAPLLREQVDDYLTQICNAYEAANFIILNRKTQPRESWSVQMPMLIKIGAKPEVLDLVMNCTYEGTRTRSGNPESLISFRGQVKGRKALADKFVGQITGKYAFDGKRGFISSVKMQIVTESSSANSDLQVVFAFDIDLERVDGNPRMLELPKSPAVVVKKDDPKTPVVIAKKNDPKTDPKTVDVVPKSVAFVKPAKAATPTSYMKLVSSPGDYIGQGKTYDYGGGQLVVKPTPRGLRITVDGWNLNIGAPKNQTLKVGEYPDAKRFAFSGDSPGLDLFGKGRGSNKVAGEFVVWELEIKDDQIVRLAIDFTQHSDGKPPLRGKIRINSGLE